VGVESPRPTLCSKLCSSRVDKRRIGTGRDRIAIEMFSARTVRFGAIRKVLIDSGRLSKPPLSADSATSPQTLSVREISTWLSDILQSPRRRVFKPSPLPESAGKPADSANASPRTLGTLAARHREFGLVLVARVVRP
jgi:hypothetical protein